MSCALAIGGQELWLDQICLKYCNDTLSFDLDDAPDLYPTLLAADGARHKIVERFRLGKEIDPEKNGQPTLNADGDDLALVGDEDGIFFLTPLLIGQIAKVDVVTVGGGQLDAWLDFNGNVLLGWKTTPLERHFQDYAVFGHVQLVGGSWLPKNDWKPLGHPTQRHLLDLAFTISSGFVTTTPKITSISRAQNSIVIT